MIFVHTSLLRPGYGAYFLFLTFMEKGFHIKSAETIKIPLHILVFNLNVHIAENAL